MFLYNLNRVSFYIKIMLVQLLKYKLLNSLETDKYYVSRQQFGGYYEKTKVGAVHWFII